MPPPYDWNDGRDGCIAGISRPFGFVIPGRIQWVITYQRGRCKYPNYEWECDTDVPILLFALVGIKAPRKKAGIHIKRGVVSHHDPNVYFPYRAIVCQNEKGMVTHHTFTWEVPGDDEVFWWACCGRSTGWNPEWSSSMSPFYNSKCKQPPPPSVTSDCQRDQSGNAGFAQYHNALGQSFRPDHAYYARELALPINQHTLTLKGPYKVKITKAAIPCYAEPILWTYTGQSQDLPDPGSKTWLHWTLPYILLEPPAVYHIVLHTLPGWFEWDVWHWIPWEPSGVLRWWQGDLAHDYPRGDWLSSCDFQHETPPWVVHAADMAFCLYE